MTTLDTPLPRAPEANRSARAIEPGTERLWPTPAQELLLRAAVLSGPPALAAWREWQSTHDLIESAVDHGSFRLLPLVYKNLAAQGAEEAHLPRLKGTYRYWWCSNQNLFYRTAEVIRALESHGIPTLVLKGAATSLLYYEDLGVRPMADIDVMVPYARAAEAVEHLLSTGWRAPTGHVDEEIRYRHSTPMVNDEGREFDLHWHALRECLRRNADAGFWERSVPLMVLDVPSRGLSPADALLHTVVHGMRWNEEPTIRWVADAMAILNHAGGAIDWEAVRREACARSVQLRLLRGLDYLKRTFDAPIPALALERLRATRTSTLERFEYRYLAVRSEARSRDQIHNTAPMLALEYLRVSAGMGPHQRLAELPGFLRYRLRGRKDPGVQAARRVARWLGLAPRRLETGETRRVAGAGPGTP